jgi:hypothetical protein
VWISPYKKHPKEIGYMSEWVLEISERIWILLLVPSKSGRSGTCGDDRTPPVLSI